MDVKTEHVPEIKAIPGIISAQRFCSMSKFITSDTAMKVTTGAVQVMGATGILRIFRSST